MPPSIPSTSLSLIDRIGQQDADAWQRLVKLYGPVVYGWARRRGLPEHDASDVMQEVFIAVSKSILNYQPGADRRLFRSWLYGISSNKINDFFRMASKSVATATTAQLHANPFKPVSRDNYFLDQELVASDRSMVLQQALQSIRGEFTDLTWKAFWRTAVDQQSAPDVAEELGLQPANVRQIKSRILRRLRSELVGLEPDV